MNQLKIENGVDLIHSDFLNKEWLLYYDILFFEMCIYIFLTQIQQKIFSLFLIL